MLYFAYGSNLDPAQMVQRCPSARFVTVAKLPDHDLAFTRYSGRRECGVSDAIAWKRRAVWGAVFAIAPRDFAALDESEGFKPRRAASKNAYTRRKRSVWKDGNPRERLAAWIYFATRQEDAPRPNAAYKKLIVDGAKHWQLPSTYRRKLSRIKVQRRST